MMEVTVMKNHLIDRNSHRTVSEGADKSKANSKR